MLKTNLLILLAVILTTACSYKEPTSKHISDIDFSNTLNEEELSGGRLTPEILWKFGRLAGGKLSPDGSKVVYSVSRYNAEHQKRTSNIFVINELGQEPVKLTEDRFIDQAPVWIQDGKKIAFLSNRYGNYQIWTMNTDGSERQKISSIPEGINGFKYAPNEEQILYIKEVKLEESIVEKHGDLPLANALSADDLMYRHWDDWHNYTYSHLFVSKVENNKIKEGTDLMEGEKWDAPLSPYFDDSEITWSPDNITIAYTCKKLYGREYAVSTNSDIYLYNTKTAETKNISASNTGYDKYPVFSPSGNKIVWMSMETPGYESDKERIMVMDLGSEKISYLNSNWDQNAHNYAWSDDEKTIYFISGKNACYQIYAVNVANKSFRAITQGQHNYTGFSIANNQLIASKTTHQMAAELFQIDLENGKETQITHVNQNIYDAIKLGHTEERWVKTTDGKDMLVWVIFPPNFDKTKKYPAILYCQGGPQSAVSQFFSYRWNFSIMAANDYIIIAPNRRGLPSFGQAWNAQISGDYSGQNMKDYLSATDALKQEPYIDENRIGCIGASYGGYSAFYLAGHHNKRFKAFISHCGIYNWESMYTATEETFFPNYDLGGPYWDKNNKTAQKSYANSPHKSVQNWDTPIMIIHGGKDFRVPYTQSLEAFNAAQLRGIPSRLLFFPEESHFVTSPQNAILWQREFFKWLDTYLK